MAKKKDATTHGPTKKTEPDMEIVEHTNVSGSALYDSYDGKENNFPSRNATPTPAGHSGPDDWNCKDEGDYDE